MKTYGSTTGTAHQIKNFYGAVGHEAKLALRVYGPAPTPVGFTNVAIRSGGAGNLTATSSAGFTSGFKARESSYWAQVQVGEVIPDYFTVERSGSSFLRRVYFYMFYHYPGEASGAHQYTMMSYSGSSADSSMRSYLGDYYGTTYKSSSLSNGTDYIDADLDIGYAARLIHQGFSPQNWGEITYYSGYNLRKSLTRQSGSALSETLISSIDYDAFAAFLSSNNVNTNKRVEITSLLGVNRWHFTDTSGNDIEIKSTDLPSTTGITTSFSATGGYLVFFDKKIPDTTSQVVTKKLRDAAEFESLCVDGGPMSGDDYTIDGQTVTAGSAISYKFGHSTGTIGDWFLSYSNYLTTVVTEGNSVGSIGNYFLYRCPVFNSALDFPSIVSIGDYFVAYCDSYNSPFTHNTRGKTIGSCFLYQDPVFNQTISLTGVKTIGRAFMLRCYAFNKSFTVPYTVTSIGDSFLAYMRDMTSTVTCNITADKIEASDATFSATNTSCASYTSGIKIAGSYKSDWQAKFPDRSSSPYRNTDVA